MTPSNEETGDTYPPYIIPDFRNPSVNVLKDNLEYPSGISGFGDNTKSGSDGKSAFNIISSGVIIEGPRFKDFHGSVGLQLNQNPKISKFEINLEQASPDISSVEFITMSTIAEIDFSKYPLDFDSFSYLGYNISINITDSIWRAARLTLDNCITDNNSILTSSNSSNKIFITSPAGETIVFLQNPNLTGITDLVYSESGEVYAAQAPVLDQTDPMKFIRKKRIISINEGLIRTEFELPTSINQEFLNYNDNISFWTGDPCLEQLKIIENSKTGRKRFGIDYYVADLLGNVIYKIDNNANVSVLAKNLRYPTSITVSSDGDLFYTSSPIFYKEPYYNHLDPFPQVHYRESLYAISPETGESRLICEFGTSNFFEYLFKRNTGIVFDYENLPCNLPLDLNVTNILYEFGNKLFFLITNTRLGNICLVRIEK